MLKNLSQVRIEKLVAGGDGLARYDGKIILVPYAVPGEIVNLRITEDKNHYYRGEITSIEESSEARTTSPCSLFKCCGGCDWLHIRYAEQVKIKKQIIYDSFLRTGKLELPEFEMETGNALQYRNRAAIHCTSRSEPGFMQKNSNKVVVVNACPVLHPLLEGELQKPRPGLFKPSQKIPLFAEGGNLHVPTNLSQEKEISVNILGKSISFSLDCFFQSNLELLPSLIEFVLRDLHGKTAMDLCCGVGLFGAFLKDSFEKIIAVDINKKSLRYARLNIPGKNHQFIHSDVTKLNHHPFQADEVQCVLVDPPRNGLTTRARAFLARLRPEKLIYVSCNPVTQARDVKDLMSRGYVLFDFKAFDFYPQTSHCETVMKLQFRL